LENDPKYKKKYQTLWPRHVQAAHIATV
jgi:hypothetical protein